MLNGGFATESYDTNAQTLAWNGRHFDVLLVLLQNNLQFPSSIDIKLCPEKLTKFIAISENLNKAILTQNKKEIVEILNQNPALIHFYNLRNESALVFALKNQLFEIYRLLIANGVKFGSHEKFAALKENMSNKELKKLKEIHFKESRFLHDNHLRILLSNSCLHHDTANINDKFNKIQKAFEVLNSNLSIQIILMIVAASRNFRILFEFNQNSVEVIDPTADSSTRGLFYSTGIIYIAAKELLDEKTEHKVFGTLAHELCHFAMNLVYKNLAKPYEKGDKEMKSKFERIQEHCKVNSSEESIISDVFQCYSSRMFHAELIVRVPHLIMHYLKEPKILMSKKKIFFELFDVYENEILSQLNNALPEIQEKAENENEIKDNKIRCLTFFSAIFLILCCISITIAMVKTPNCINQNLSSDDRQIEIHIEETKLFYQNNTGEFEILNRHDSYFLSGLITFVKDDSLSIYVCKNLRKELKQNNFFLNFSLKNGKLINVEKVVAQNSTFKSTSNQIIDSLKGNNMNYGEESELKLNTNIAIDSMFSAQNSINIKWNTSRTIKEKLDFLVDYGYCSQMIMPTYLFVDLCQKAYKLNYEFIQF